MPEIKSVVVFRDGKIRYSETEAGEWWSTINDAARKNGNLEWFVRHDFVHFGDPTPRQHTSVTYIFSSKDVAFIRAATDVDRAILGAR